MKRIEKRGICGICSAGCWIVAEYENNKIVKVRPDEGTDMGILCHVGEHAPEIIYSEDRLLHPMKRKGPKGTYDFERISWDEAYNTIVTTLNQTKKDHGPEAAAIYTGVGTFELALCDIYQPKGVHVSSASSVLFPFGSPNTMGAGALCYVAYGMIAPHSTCGEYLTDMYNDIENSELVVVWGTNPATDLPPVDMQRIMEAKARGAEIVVIDPRRTGTVKLADGKWIPIRPGTDGALALGLCHVLIAEELYDDAFARDWTLGFDEFSRYVQHFRPEVVEGITGISAETVITLARRIASARGASQLMYTGLEFSSSGVQASRAALILWALAGQLDVPGGRCFSMKANHFPINREGLVANPDTGIRIGKDRFPVYIHYRDEAHAIDLPKSVLEGIPYRIRSLIIQGASMVTSWPEPEKWRKTLEALELVVCIDRQLTADMAYADIILPASTLFEVKSYMTYGSLFRIREQMIEPRGESRSDLFIMAELAQRLGYGDLYPQDSEELLEYVLKDSGFTSRDVEYAGGTVSIESEMMQYKKWEKGLLRPDGQPGFDTPSGKLEIASSLLEDFGYNPLPEYTEPREGPVSRPDLLREFPLIFNSGGRFRSAINSQHHGIKGLSRKRPEPTVMINSMDAEKRNIKNGDMARITTGRGSLTMRAIVTDDIMKGSIDANHGCGGPIGPEAWQDRNINDLTDLEQFDPISGFPVYKSLLCNVALHEEGNLKVEVDAGELKKEEMKPVLTAATGRQKVYLDNNATTHLSDEAREAMSGAMSFYGNPSSIHQAGRDSRRIIDEARRKVAGSLNCTARRIIFTGSGSEANNLAIKGVLFSGGFTSGRIITSSVEHPAVLNTCIWLKEQGYDVVFLPVDETGSVNPRELFESITPDTRIVSIMMANNETGTFQPVQECAAIAHEAGIPFHCDAVQGFGKIPIDVRELELDLLTVSAHKVHGPKGIGALYAGKGVSLESLVHGGGHEFGLRSGTENIPAIAGFGAAAEQITGMLGLMQRVRELRDMLEDGLGAFCPDYSLNGHRENRLPNTLNVTIPGFRGESLVLALDHRGIYISSGSACKSGHSGPSHTLTAMGLSDESAHCSLRFSLGVTTTKEGISLTLESLEDIIKNSKTMVHFVPCR